MYRDNTVGVVISAYNEDSSVRCCNCWTESPRTIWSQYVKITLGNRLLARVSANLLPLLVGGVFVTSEILLWGILDTYEGTV